MASVSALNPLSCSRCKERKVKCDRVTPTCGRCETYSVECFYPKRAKRRSTKPVVDDNRSHETDRAFATILERLQTIEQNYTALHQQPVSQHLSTITSFPVNESLGGYVHSATASPAGFAVSKASPISVVSSTSASSSSRKSVDAITALELSLVEVKKQVLRRTQKSIVSGTLDIPKHLSKNWVNAFFKYKRTDMFLGHIDRGLIELMPELINRDHIHVDAAIVVIYYSLLYQGCGITASTSSPSDIKYCEDIRICCLRVLPIWQREASGTMVDLIAAISMVMLATDSFDHDLGWEMYQLACEFANSLNLHNLDAGSSPTSGQKRVSDDSRQGFWELIQVDLIFQLFLDKPPTITATNWKVNMPWLNPDSNPIGSDKDRTLFITGTRNSFVHMRFFSTLEESRHGSHEELMHKTRVLCQEIQDLYDEGLLGNWVLDSTENEADLWRILDMTLMGHVSMIFMLRKAAMCGPGKRTHLEAMQEMLNTPIAFKAARGILEASAWLMKKYPWSASLAVLCGAFQIHLPYGLLASAILGASDKEVYLADIRTLEQITESVGKIAMTEKEYMPFSRVLQSLLTEVRSSDSSSCYT